MIRLLGKLDTWIDRLAGKALVIAVLGMLAMSVLNISLRWLNHPINWFEPFVRHLVFLCAFLGGILATGRKNHVAIDVISKYLQTQKHSRASAWVERVVALASTGALIWLAIAGWQYVLVEAEFGRAHFLGIHSKYLSAIIPLGLGLIAYRFLFIFVSSFDKRAS